MSDTARRLRLAFVIYKMSTVCHSPFWIPDKTENHAVVILLYFLQITACISKSFSSGRRGRSPNL